MYTYMLLIFASVYGEGSYGENIYSASASTPDPSGGGGGGLANTGVLLVGLATFACFLIFVALLLRHYGRKNKTQTK